MRGITPADNDATLFSLDGSDNLIIVLDRTNSMDHIIESMKAMLAQYVLRHVATSEAVANNTLQLGLVTIDDHYVETCTVIHANASYVKAHLNQPAHITYGLTDNLEEFMYWIYNVPIGHGDDVPEAYACGIQAAIRLDPKASIWVVGDSTPHGYATKYTGYSDAFPDGCPCGADLPKPDQYNIKSLITAQNPTAAIAWRDAIGYPTLWVNDFAKRIQRDVEVTETFDEIVADVVPAHGSLFPERLLPSNTSPRKETFWPTAWT